MRAAVAKAGIYANDPSEAMYPYTRKDSHGEALDGSKHNYTLTFAKGQFPPVNAFWSVTMYDGQEPVADRKPDQPLSDQFTDAAGDEEKPRWITDDLHPEQIAGKGERIELAAGAQRPHLHAAAPVLAEDGTAVDFASGRRYLAAAGRGQRIEVAARKKDMKTQINIMRRITAAGTVLLGALLAAGARGADVTPAEARAIAKEAYIYGFPMVDSYRIQYDYFVNNKNPEFKAPWNHIANTPRVYTPADTTIQTPNADTPYSWLGMDLRAEPIVLTMPVIRKDRYFSIQLIDAYTFNFAYIGSRATGNDGGVFLIAGPGWKGETPKGVTKVIRSETDFIFAFYRIQLFNPSDIDNVKKVQAGYKAQTLSAFLEPRTEAAPAIDFIKPLSPNAEKTSLEFFNILNFALQFCPTDPSEIELMARFAKIGVGGRKDIGC